MYFVTLYFSNWHHSWSTMDSFKSLDDAIRFVSQYSTPDLQTVSIVKRSKKL